MRRILFLITIFITCFGISANVFPSIINAASYDFSPASGNYPNECEKEVVVNINPGTEASNAADIEIRFDPTKIDIIDSLPLQTGTQVSIGTAYENYVYNNVDLINGIIKIAAGSFNNDLTTQEVFVRIIFKAKPAITTAGFTIYFTGTGDTLDSNIAESSTHLDLLTSVTNGTYTFSDSLSCYSVVTPPIENPASYFDSPTNIGSNVTFQSVATDPNNFSYYLLLCKTGGTPTPGNNAPPSCNGVPGNQLCVSTMTASGALSSCNHSTTGETSIESQVWYAFICDHNSSSTCSAAFQGSGSSGSPYWVNHSPTLTVAPLTPSMNPGGSVTFTALAANWGDPDVSLTQDTAKLLVCNTSGVNSNGTCIDTQLCVSTSLLPGNDLACTFDDSGNPVKLSGVHPAFVFIIDNHNFWEAGGAQGTNVTYNVNNLDPVVVNVIINKGNDINLIGNSNTSIKIISTITDQNSCMDFAGGITAKLYRSSLTFAGCTSNNSNCYQITSSNCTVDNDISNGPLDTCSGTSDTSVRYSCNANLTYYTDPTDGVITSNPYYADNWLATVTALDNLLGIDSYESASGVEVNSLNAMQITDTIDYGLLDPNWYSGGGAFGTLNIPVTITNVGNIGQDAETAGNGPGMCTTSCADIIPLSQQKWEITNNSTTWTAGTNILNGTISPIDIIINKPTTLTHPTLGNIYWGIHIPSSQTSGIYTGANTINSVVNDPADW